MRSLRSAVVIAAKDIAQRRRDRSAYVMGLLGPLLLAFILSATLGGAEDPEAFELGWADEDNGPVAAGFRSLLADLESVDVVEITAADGRTELDRLVDDGDVAAGFHLGEGFSAAVESGSPATIEVVGDPGSPLGTDVAESIARTFASELDAVSLATRSVLSVEGGTGDPARVAELTAAVRERSPAIELAAVEIDGRGADLTTYYAVSLSVFFVFFTVQFGVLSLIEERETGTLERMLVAPIAPATVVLGKLLSSLAIGVASMAVLVVATTVALGAEWGDPVAVGVLILVGVVVAIALAALVSAVAKTAEQAVALAVGAALVLGLLGGTFFPISRSGGLLSVVSRASPHRWLLDGFRDVSYGAGLGELGVPLAVLGAFIVIVGGTGLLAARHGLVRS